MSCQFLGGDQSFDAVAWVSDLTVVDKVKRVVDHPVECSLALGITCKRTSIDKSHREVLS